MSRKTVSAVIGSLLVVGFALGAVQGCGSSSPSAGSVMSLCMQGCAKESSLCGADAGETMADCMQGCVSTETTSTGGACSNQSAILAAGNACLAKTTCAELELCVATVPTCAGGTGGASGTGTGGRTSTGGTSGTGTGGTTGTGGSTGAAGASGTATCASCDKAQTCCLALAALLGQSTSACTFSTSSCNAETGAAQTTDAMTCGMLLTSGAALSTSCK
jgi:hypothetical protein